MQLSGMPLSVLLGPGLIGNIYDGIQRPLPGIAAQSGAWIRRGEKVPARIDTGSTVATPDNMKEPRIAELLSPPVEKYLEK